MTLLTGTIFDIKKYAIHDGPGIRTAVFFKGCPLDCWWCHNPESQARAPELMFRTNRCTLCGECVEVCPQGAIEILPSTPAQSPMGEGGTRRGEGVFTDRARCQRCETCAQSCYSGAREFAGHEMSVAQLMAEIERDVLFYDQSGGGVTFTGGEPLMQPRFLRALLQACREHDIHTVVDTSGYASWETIDSLREYVNLFLYDLKFMDDARHRQYTSVSNAPVLRNLKNLIGLRNLSGLGPPAIIVRIPLIPGINDDVENLRALGEFLASLPHLNGVELMPYHAIALAKYASLDRPYRLNGTQPPTAEAVQQAAEILRGFGLLVR